MMDPAGGVEPGVRPCNTRLKMGSVCRECDLRGRFDRDVDKDKGVLDPDAVPVVDDRSVPGNG